MGRMTGRVGAGLVLVGVLVAGPLSAQAPPRLPDEVSAWLARDQVQRWAQMIQQGDSIFNSGSCARCHGEAGSGGRNGPDLADSEWTQSDGSLEGIRETIFWGVRRRDFSDASRRFEMNPGGGLGLEWAQYASLAAYVWSLSNGTQLPGG